MIRAGSLTYAVFVSTVTAILCLMMILLASMNRSFFIQTDNYDRVKDNARSGIALGLASPGERVDQWYTLYEPGQDSVRLKKRKWGLYEVISSKAVLRQATFSRTAISGYRSPRSEGMALWLTDRNRPLQLSGEALLKGEFYLPKKGVDRAYIEGTNYSRKELLYGPSRLSESRLPELSGGIIKEWRTYLKGQVHSGDSVLNAESLPQNLSHSFTKKTALYDQKGTLLLDGYTLRGNMILRSQTRIDVTASTVLDQVVLVAPVIRIHPGFHGRLHAVASDTLLVQSGVVLSYPSSLLVVLDQADQSPYLHLAEGSEVRGGIASWSDVHRRTNDLSVEINEGALLKGMLYCNGQVELTGTIEGGAVVQNFLLSTASGIYENHVLNGKIDRTALEKKFLGWPVATWNNQADIATWVAY